MYLFLNEFYITYLDNILIYSETIDKYHIYIRKVIEALSKARLYPKPEKCTIHKIDVKYLGLIISAKGIKMDPQKLEAIIF